MIRFVDAYRDQFGVEPICSTLCAAEGGFMTARGYHAAKVRPVSARGLRDELLVDVVRRVHEQNFSVYGVRKMHAALKREGWLVGRDQTSRLMRKAGLRGAIRGRRVWTTISDAAQPHRPDLVERSFTATRPIKLWVADITYIRTWAGFAYAAFVIDVFSRRIVGWNVASRLSTDALPLEALDMAAWQTNADLAGLIHHSDLGSQYGSIRYTNRLAELGITPSVGSRGDSYDNALAETIIGLYKTELVRPRGPWRTVDEVELATLEWVWWYNHQRLHSELDYQTPVEIETAYYATPEPPRLAAASLTNH